MFNFINRKHDVQNLSVNADAIFKPELQGMFNRAEMVGYLKKVVKIKKTGTVDYIMVLTNVGIILFDLAKVPKIFNNVQKIKSKRS